MTEPHPLVLEPILKPKVWGGRRLAAYGKPLPDEELIGESWELADLAATSASGGGGGQARSRVARGPLGGRTLGEVLELWGGSMIEPALLRADGSFPLLVKYLDAREHLSVQVHPSPAYAAAHPEAHLKTECWHVLEAEPGAVIYKGLRPGVGGEDLREAIEAGHVPEVIESVPAVPGACHLLPSGTVHALGAGVLVAEVQSPSDTTYRLYDWAAEYGRAGRELHVEPALGCALLDPPPPPATLGDAREATLVETPLFTLRALRLEAGESRTIGVDRAPLVVMAVESGLSLGVAGAEPVAVERGETALVPASAAPEAVCRSEAGGVVLLAGLGRS